MRCSSEPRNWILVIGYGFLLIVKNMIENIDKYLRKNLSGKYCQKLLHCAKQSATNALKTAPKREDPKQRKQLVIWLAMKLLTKLKKSQKFTATVQRQVKG